MIAFQPIFYLHRSRCLNIILSLQMYQNVEIWNISSFGSITMLVVAVGEVACGTFYARKLQER